ncbi:DUF4491 family protein [Miniphocaeibacter halophilus]|uniref:DUF4491 family protein n=1 Tax=Miniphocaeibacter halophilus TaxID=2931922 RepID=A0AC61MPE5_9FIRM|nr:DUF4491 family protein [Miniphocaeibacter halophilus]QQK07415.1 DUF4491 family protein [Miniphocaeibacter halophilus]
MKGVLIGLITFLIIGIFHPIVIKGEYYFGVKIWPIFAVLGIIFIALGFYIEEIFWSAILSVLGFTCLWSILELFEQRQRVRKGWFPENPKRKKGK